MANKNNEQDAQNKDVLIYQYDCYCAKCGKTIVSFSSYLSELKHINGTGYCPNCGDGVEIEIKQLHTL